MTAATPWQGDIAELARNIRLRVFAHVLANNGGYLSQALSSAEIFALLYGRVMRLGPSIGPTIPEPFRGVPGPHNDRFFNGGAYNGANSPENDRFIFSPAHYALVLYATLIEVGRMSDTALGQFNQDGSTVEMIGAEHSPGIETTTGSLAQALSQAGGTALARKLRHEPGRVWVMMSDGEFQEGQTWEAIALISWHQLDNLRVVVDANSQQCDGCMTDTGPIEPLGDRIRAFGGSVDEVDGHDIVALEEALTHDTGRPHFVIARTNPTQGVALFEERAPFLHYLRFSSDQERDAYQQTYQEMTN